MRNAEIDGLRAVAVLGVLVYHLKPDFLPGGFTGVDVFFVISGYVITGSLAGREDESFKEFILGFYRRRVVRILPALLIFVAVLSLFSVLFVPHSWLSAQNFWTALAAVWGAGNLALVGGEDGYFADRVDFNPFTHTWSLGVEEQFYLIYPILFYFLMLKREDRRYPGALMLVALAALSLVVAVVQTASSPSAAFYLLPARFWQLACGAILFQLISAQPIRLASLWTEAFAWGGILLIAVGFALASPGVIPFPMAVVTVLGTSLLVAGVSSSGANRSLVASTLRHPAFVYVGRISYSLYLWHWGIIVLLRWTIGVESLFQIVVAGLLSFVLAHLSFQLVERPAQRFSSSHESLTVRYALPSALVALVAASACVVALFGAQRRLGFGISVTKDRSVWMTRSGLPASRLVSSADTTRRAILVVGDSHAGMYSPMVDSVARLLHLDAAVFSVSGCSVASLLAPEPTSGPCEGTMRAALVWLRQNSRPGDVVFLASLRTERFIGQAVVLRAPRLAGAGSREHGYSVALAQAVEFVSTLERMQLKVLIDAPKPVFRSPPFRCSDWFNRVNPICDGGFEVSRSELLERRRPVVQSLDSLERVTGAEVWDPFLVLCPDLTCSAFRDGHPLFFDGDHLSNYGGLQLVDSFSRAVTELLGN